MIPKSKSIWVVVAVTVAVIAVWLTELWCMKGGW